MMETEPADEEEGRPYFTIGDCACLWEDLGILGAKLVAIDPECPQHHCRAGREA